MKSSDYIKDAMNNAYAKQVFLTKFLTPKEQEELVYMCGNNFYVYFDGGYSEAVLKRALVSAFEVDEVNLKVKCIELTTANKFYTLRHPTVKWHFLNLGIDEKMFGDIILVDETFVVVMAQEVFETVMKDSEKINRCPIAYKETSDVIVNDTKEEYKAFCSGLRLDNVIAKTFHLSRERAQKLIENESVRVSSEVVKKLTYLVSVDDILNIRGYGKVIIKRIDINNKSGKYIIIHNRFLHKKK